MRIRPWLVLAALFIPAGAAHADDHSADLYGAFSYCDGSSLWGFHESYALTVADNKRYSVLTDLSLHFGSHDASTATRVTYLVGPRVTLPRRVVPAPNKVHVHLLVGGVHTNAGVAASKGFAVALGGAWESLPGNFPGNRNALTLDERKWGLRAQVDYVITVGEGDNFPRVSGGIVYRFKK